MTTRPKLDVLRPRQTWRHHKSQTCEPVCQMPIYDAAWLAKETSTDTNRSAEKGARR